MAAITTDIWNQRLHNSKRPNHTKFARYVHSVVTYGHLSGIVLPLVLIPCLLGWTPCSQITLTCLIRVAVERKTTISNDNLPEVLAANTRKTESSTIVMYLRYFQKVAEQANLTYVNIVQDIGTIVAELKVVWNCIEEFGNVIVHPGDFQIRRKTFRLI